MKENFQIHIWLGLLLCLLGMSCSDDTPAKGDDPGNGNTELEVNEWIESVMRSDYLWNNDIPAQNKLDFSADPQTFFRSMLSLKDGKTRNGKHLYYYSYMEKNKDYKARTSIDADDTYGMEFTLFNVVNDSNQPLGYYYARILYVLPNSPASSAGLERGDWIVGVKGKNNINSDNYGILLNGDRTQWLVKRGDTEVRTIDIEASRAVEDNPLFYHNVYTRGDKKIGYLVYNHFTSGPNGYSDRTYDEEMKKIFAGFQAQGVNEFVLDLRYNGGGYENSANMLAGLLIPEASRKKVFAVFSDNKGQSYSNDFCVETKGTAGYLKLNSNRIYILTSQSTASSSEVVINSLNPFMDVTLIGELTEGKNVGMEMRKNDKYEWIYWPITLRVTNAVNDDYSAGFKPDIEWNEYDLTQNPTDALLPLGDPDEFMLGKAISLITGINRSARSMNTLSQPIMRGESVYQSTERHATGGMLMVPEEKNN